MNRRISNVLTVSVITLLIFFQGVAFADFTPSGKLEIHYINVGQGGCTLIIGPNGDRILYDFGDVSGDRDIVPFLRDTLNLRPEQGLHYTIVSHRDSDHYMGYKAVVDAGYDVLVANFDSGSPKNPTANMKKFWLEPARETTAGEIRSIPLGLRISLGDGAEAIVMAANGKVYRLDHGQRITNENDRSVSLFIHYRNFQYILDGDLGSGREKCTSHDTSQKEVQPYVAQSLINLDLMDPGYGVDVLHVAHHGSESSTSAKYFNLVRPEVALINVGINQKKSFLHPRKDVVDQVLLGEARAECVTAPPVEFLFQTEDGYEGESTTGKTSNSGLSVGSISLITDGETDYEIRADGKVHGGSVETGGTGVWTFVLDEKR